MNEKRKSIEFEEIFLSAKGLGQGTKLRGFAGF
jgi:hypothetical protein